MRKLVIGGAALASAAAFVLPGSIADASTTVTSGNTTLTITITGGGVTISTPGNKSLGTGTLGSLPGSYTATLDPVTVVDNRGVLAATYTTSATLTNWTSSQGSGGNVAPTSTVLGISGTVSTSPAIGPVVTAPLGSFAGGTTSTPGTAATGLATYALGAFTATWTPTVTVTPLPGEFVAAGTYTATFTQSVTY